MPPARFSASPDPVQAGGILTICFDGSIEPAFEPGATVEVTVNNGFAPDEYGHMSATVQITLGQDREGCVEWQVPSSGWGNAGLLQHPSSVDGTFIVLDP